MTALRIAAGRLNLDDVGTEVGEDTPAHVAERASQVEHAIWSEQRHSFKFQRFKFQGSNPRSRET
jgi:hypothetical protein